MEVGFRKTLFLVFWYLEIQAKIQKCSKTSVEITHMSSTHGRGLHGPDFFVQARPGSHGYNLGPARSKEKNFDPGLGRLEKEIEI